jgi:histidinol-phosphate aminotransferase
MTTNGTPKPINAFNLKTCARPNILKLQPYRCARDDYKDNGTNVLLDANENAYGPGLAIGTSSSGSTKKLAAGAETQDGERIQVDLEGLNRYPDPY